MNMIKSACLLAIILQAVSRGQSCKSDHPKAFMCQPNSVSGLAVTLDVSTAARTNATQCTCSLKSNVTGLIVAFNDNPNSTNCGAQVDLLFEEISMQLKCGVPADNQSTSGSFAKVIYTREMGIDDVDSKYCLTFYANRADVSTVLSCADFTSVTPTLTPNSYSPLHDSELLVNSTTTQPQSNPTITLKCVPQSNATLITMQQTNSTTTLVTTQSTYYLSTIKEPLSNSTTTLTITQSQSNSMANLTTSDHPKAFMCQPNSVSGLAVTLDVSTAARTNATQCTCSLKSNVTGLIVAFNDNPNSTNCGAQVDLLFEDISIQLKCGVPADNQSTSGSSAKVIYTKEMGVDDVDSKYCLTFYANRADVSIVLSCEDFTSASPTITPNAYSPLDNSELLMNPTTTQPQSNSTITLKTRPQSNSTLVTMQQTNSTTTLVTTQPTYYLSTIKEPLSNSTTTLTITQSQSNSMANLTTSDHPKAFMCQPNSVSGLAVTLDVSTAARTNATQCTCSLKSNITGLIVAFNDNPNSTNCGAQLDLLFEDISIQLKCGVPADNQSTSGSSAKIIYTREMGVDDVDSKYCLTFYANRADVSIVLSCEDFTSASPTITPNAYSPLDNSELLMNPTTTQPQSNSTITLKTRPQSNSTLVTMQQTNSTTTLVTTQPTYYLSTIKEPLSNSTTTLTITQSQSNSMANLTTSDHPKAFMCQPNSVSGLAVTLDVSTAARTNATQTTCSLKSNITGLIVAFNDNPNSTNCGTQVDLLFEDISIQLKCGVQADNQPTSGSSAKVIYTREMGVDDVDSKYCMTFYANRADVSIVLSCEDFTSASPTITPNAYSPLDNSELLMNPTTTQPQSNSTITLKTRPQSNSTLVTMQQTNSTTTLVTTQPTYYLSTIKEPLSNSTTTLTITQSQSNSMANLTTSDHPKAFMCQPNSVSGLAVTLDVSTAARTNATQCTCSLKSNVTGLIVAFNDNPNSTNCGAQVDLLFEDISIQLKCGVQADNQSTSGSSAKVIYTREMGIDDVDSKYCLTFYANRADVSIVLSCADFTSATQTITPNASSLLDNSELLVNSTTSQPQSNSTTTQTTTQRQSNSTTTLTTTKPESNSTTTLTKTQPQSYSTTTLTTTRPQSNSTTTLTKTQPQSYSTTTITTTQPQSNSTTTLTTTQLQSSSTTTLTTQPQSNSTTTLTTQPQSNSTTTLTTQPQSNSTFVTTHQWQDNSTTNTVTTQSPYNSSTIIEPLSNSTTTLTITQSQSNSTATLTTSQSPSNETNTSLTTQSLSTTTQTTTDPSFHSTTVQITTPFNQFANQTNALTTNNSTTNLTTTQSTPMSTTTLTTISSFNSTTHQITLQPLSNLTTSQTHSQSLSYTSTNQTTTQSLSISTAAPTATQLSPNSTASQIITQSLSISTAAPTAKQLPPHSTASQITTHALFNTETFNSTFYTPEIISNTTQSSSVNEMSTTTSVNSTTRTVFNETSTESNNGTYENVSTTQVTTARNSNTSSSTLSTSIFPNATTDYLNGTTTESYYNVTTVSQNETTKYSYGHVTTVSHNETTDNITTEEITTIRDNTKAFSSGFWEPPDQEYGVPSGSTNIVAVIAPVSAILLLVFIGVVVFIMCKRSRKAARRTKTPDNENKTDKNYNYQRPNFLAKDPNDTMQTKPPNPADFFTVLTSDKIPAKTTAANELNGNENNLSQTTKARTHLKSVDSFRKANGDTMLESGKPQIYEPNEREKDILDNLELASIVIESDPDDSNRYFKKTDPGDWYRVIMKGKKPRDSEELLDTLGSTKERSKRKNAKNSGSEDNSDRENHRSRKSRPHTEKHQKKHNNNKTSKSSKSKSSESDEKTYSGTDKKRHLSNTTATVNKSTDQQRKYDDITGSNESMKNDTTVQPKLVISKPLNKETMHSNSQVLIQPKQVMSKPVNERNHEREPVQTRLISSKSSSVTMPVALPRQNSTGNLMNRDLKETDKEKYAKQESSELNSSISRNDGSETSSFRDRNTPQRSSQTRNTLFSSGSKINSQNGGTDNENVESKLKPVKRPDIVPPLNLTGTGDKVGRTDDGFEEFLLN